MAKIKFTDLAIQNLKRPAKGQKEYWDNSLPGFGIRVSQGGSMMFFAWVNRRRKNLGRYPTVTLKEAREAARQVLLERFGSQREGQKYEMSYAEAVDRYLRVKREEIGGRTLKEYERFLRRFEFPCLVSEIRPYELSDALDRVKGNSNRSHAYTVLKIFFNWCVSREYCKANPLQNLKKPRVPSSRERVLEDWELVAIWQATEDMGKYGKIVRLLMLTGQRRGQFDRLQEAWVGDDGIDFPAFVTKNGERHRIMKNGQAHFCPLSSLGKFVLMQTVPVGGYYFSPIGMVGRPFTAWSKNKRALDAKLKLDPWVLHDLRRTWATNCGRLDISAEIRDRIMSHTVGGNPVSRVYDRWKYRQQMADAMEKMNSFFLEQILSEEPELTM